MYIYFNPRTLIHGDLKAGFTVFWADDGLDTGPILLQRECDLEPDDTVNTIYKRFLFPEGVKGTVSLWPNDPFKIKALKVDRIMMYCQPASKVSQ